MSLEERTLVVRNIDGDKLSAELLEELFCNFGPVVRIVLRKNHAFVEYTKKDSVGYAWAMTEGITLQGRVLRCAPKNEDDPQYYVYKDLLIKFQNRMETDKEYVKSLLTAEQVNEKNQLINALNKRSSNTLTTVRRRLQKYELHCQQKSTYNPILDRDLVRECSASNHERSHSLDHGQAINDWQTRHHNYLEKHAAPQYHSQPTLSEQAWNQHNSHQHQTDWANYEHQREFQSPHGHNQYRPNYYQQPPPPPNYSPQPPGHHFPGQQPGYPYHAPPHMYGSPPNAPPPPFHPPVEPYPPHPSQYNSYPPPPPPSHHRFY